MFAKPGTSKPSVKVTDGDEKFIALQKRVDELEKIHKESKRTHQVDLERVRGELARAQKSNSDLVERLEKSKKQTDLLEGKVQELRKSSLSDQAEIKDLRVKFKLSEHERTQLSEKQEKNISNEKKKREAIEAQCQALKSKGDSEVKAVRAATQTLETRLKEAQNEAKKATAVAMDAQESYEAKEAQVLDELEQYKLLLCRVTAEYGRLASSTVARAEHTRLKHEHAALQFKTLRLGRKLANTEDQVVELAHLIRCVKSENNFLSKDLSQLEDDVRRLFICPPESRHDPVYHGELDSLCTLMERDLRSNTDQVTRTYHLLSEFYNLTVNGFKAAYLSTEADLGEAYASSNLLRKDITASLSDNSTLRLQIEAGEAEIATLQQRLAKIQLELTEARQTAASLDAELDNQALALKREKDATHRLQNQLKKARATEEVLQAELDQLMADLTEAERYQEAYANLYDEVSELAARNKLAESEAERLSKFNAEIVGHANPAQKIAYLDRIRQELAETKQELLMATRAHDSLQAENDGLQHELDLYKSVTAHPKEKIRTNITRISRHPLKSLNAADEMTVEEVMP